MAKGYHTELAEAREDGELGDGELDVVERQSMGTLKKLSEERLSSKFSAPVQALVNALDLGETKKAINLVQVLLDIKDEQYAEHIRDKESIEDAMNAYYIKAWNLQAQLARSKREQRAKHDDSETRRNRILDLQTDNEDKRTLILRQQNVLKGEKFRCKEEEEKYSVREVLNTEDVENIVKLTSLLRSLYQKRMPTACPRGLFEGTDGQKALCSGEDQGWCTFNAVTGEDQKCSCNVGFYGDACEKMMCPGFGDVLHPHDSKYACSEQGTCNYMTGKCETCKDGFYHGEKKGCEHKHCPGSGENGDTVDELCSGNGSCDRIEGVCTCSSETSGAGCFEKKCLASNGVLYPFDSGNVCDGQGACDLKTGECSCQAPYFGETCHKKECPSNCLDEGVCNHGTGLCFCNAGRSGPRCEFVSCPDDCSGSDAGWCDAVSGKCMCKYGYGGESCKKVQHCSADNARTTEVNWYTLWDKPGWAICPTGQALTSLYRSDCNTLACLDSAKCAGLCSGDDQLEVNHCYHSLGWYDTFDEKGWSTCESDYYLAGFYRSGDSLYNLQMAKCCSFKNARWTQCQLIDWGSTFKEGKGWTADPNSRWLTSLYRGKEQGLGSISRAKACGFSVGF